MIESAFRSYKCNYCGFEVECPTNVSSVPHSCNVSTANSSNIYVSNDAVACANTKRLYDYLALPVKGFRPRGAAIIDRIERKRRTKLKKRAKKQRRK